MDAKAMAERNAQMRVALVRERAHLLLRLEEVDRDLESLNRAASPTGELHGDHVGVQVPLGAALPAPQMRPAPSPPLGLADVIHGAKRR